MLKAEDLARREDRRVRGVKIGKTRRDRGISHVWQLICTFVFTLAKSMFSHDTVPLELGYEHLHLQHLYNTTVRLIMLCDLISYAN